MSLHLPRGVSLTKRKVSSPQAPFQLPANRTALNPSNAQEQSAQTPTMYLLKVGWV